MSPRHSNDYHDHDQASDYDHNPNLYVKLYHHNWHWH